METNLGCKNGAVKQEQDLGTCHLMNSKKSVGCKCVYTVKYETDGTIEHYKGRLVVKRFTQTDGVNYLETLPRLIK